MNNAHKKTFDPAETDGEGSKSKSVSRKFAHHDSITPDPEAQDGVTPNQPCTVSVISSTNPPNLSKTFYLDAANTLGRENGGKLYSGHYRRELASTPRQLADLIQSLGTNEALNFGTAGEQPLPVTTKAKPNPGHIDRTKDCFDWPTGPGWLMIDYDPAPGETPRDCWMVMAALSAAIKTTSDRLSDSELLTAPCVTVASGSSHIYNTDTGECLKGAGGLRWYIKIADVSDIGRAGKVLFERLWLAGYGFHIVSDRGDGLPRSVIDATVYSPERLDFAAGAATVAPLEQRRPKPEAYNNDAPVLDTRAALPDLT